MTNVSKLAWLISCGTWVRCWATGLNTIPKIPMDKPPVDPVWCLLWVDGPVWFNQRTCLLRDQNQKAKTVIRRGHGTLASKLN